MTSLALGKPLAKHRKKIKKSTAGFLFNFILSKSYYLFVFSLPFEAVDIGLSISNFSLSKIAGYLFLFSTFLRPTLSYKYIPRAFLYFLSYILFIFFLNLLSSFALHPLVISQIFTQLQLLVLFWASFNLMRVPEFRKGFLWALVVSCCAMIIFQAAGIGSETGKYGRESGFGSNPNAFAAVLSLGFLAYFGMTFGQWGSNVQKKIFFLFTAGFFLIAIVRSGSRGSLLALIFCLFIFLLHKKSLVVKIRTFLLVSVGIVVLIVASFQIESVRVRWERTVETGDLAGRETIFSSAWDMFTEKPLVGWGAVTQYFELGRREGVSQRSTHNVYLWILVESGLVGAVLFFSGVGSCLHSAWKARNELQDILALAMLLFYLIVSMKGAYHFDKLFWIILAYGLSGGSTRRIPGWRIDFKRAD